MRLIRCDYQTMIAELDDPNFKDSLADFKILLTTSWFKDQEKKELIKLYKDECKKRGIDYEENN